MVTYLRRNHLALLALFIALGGTSYAAAQLPRNSVGPAQIKRNAVTSADVRDRTLRRQDFRRGALLRGPKGDTGARGATGPRGATGTVDASNFFTKAQTDARYPRFAAGTSGLVVKRVVSTDQTTGDVIGRVGAATFVRDASTAVAFRLITGATAAVFMDCYGVTIGGAPVAKRATILPSNSTVVLTGVDAFEGFTCQLLDSSAQLRQTQITLQRIESSAFWVGTVLSTDDQ